MHASLSLNHLMKWTISITLFLKNTILQIHFYTEHPRKGWSGWNCCRYRYNLARIRTQCAADSSSPAHWDSPGRNDGFVQDCSNSSANALELLQSCTKPSIITLTFGDTRCTELPNRGIRTRAVRAVCSWCPVSVNRTGVTGRYAGQGSPTFRALLCNPNDIFNALPLCKIPWKYRR